ncbi:MULTISPECIES: tripartite tricarboxylate transporter substrate binding protein [Dethiosulfovibrio]|uniref:Tripartite tricarboxylate transporter substrate binding protein n=2 Tax=Dethiosulfovibrio TaxID=47054 RepID=A0ABS9ERK9_9BACT|nr:MULTISPECIES: tripartite tricarboxylate transporter substrate binding protein [Dethiosulfovibrio]MCF4114433.1 tripartite tricarboxylate transporter substrate binding protein [Dethiosulfovibrio russensis]MCF4142906.1 tripartite tricarboxylate transporter substrate binding protein [Dethiosulfovibrio marinus]MCF4145003.1 tripartite tricarboxylate transporter substrate binding protein [Dethiosulfovibrio acidaminovorans]
MKRGIALGVLLGILCLAGTAWAAYPEKPVTVIVPSNAGGGTDTMARLVAKFAEEYLGQPMVIVNKPGAGGQIGFESIARAKKDGYTIGCIYTPHVAAHVSAGRAKYTLDSFAPIANVVTDPGVLVVKADSPFNTVEELIAFAKENPGKLNGSTSGPGGDDDFALRQFEKAAGISINAVPSKGSSGQKAAVMGGHVDLAFMNASQVEAQVDSGELRLLGIMTVKRRSYLPELPTFKEMGYEVYSDSSRGFAAPAGVPKDVMAKLMEVFDKVLNDPEFIAASQGQLLLDILNADEYTMYLKNLQKTTDEAFKVAPW